jgi:hypothetical protein
VFNNDSSVAVSYDNQVFRNNILATADGPAFRYDQQKWAATHIIQNNVIYGSGGGPVFQYGATGYNWSGFQSFSANYKNNVNGDPKFRNALPADYKTPARFDFSILSGSPAINAGTATGAPAIDIRGNTRTGAPDAGAYEAP